MGFGPINVAQFITNNAVVCDAIDVLIEALLPSIYFLVLY